MAVAEVHEVHTVPLLHRAGGGAGRGARMFTHVRTRDDVVLNALPRREGRGAESESTRGNHGMSQA